MTNSNNYTSIILPGLMIASVLATSGCAAQSAKKTNSEIASTINNTNSKTSTRITSPSKIKLVIPKRIKTAYLLPISNSSANFEQAMLDSVKKHLDAKSYAVVKRLIETDSLTVKVVTAKEFPLPPKSVLTVLGCSEKDIAIFAAAKKFSIIIASLEPDWPPIDSLYARAAVGAYATDCNSLVQDLHMQTISSGSQISKLALTQIDTPRFTDHMLLIASQSKSGMWYSTKGLDNFGLPEIQLFDAPPDLSPSLSRVINTLGWKLVALSKHKKKSGKDEIIELPSTLEITAEDIDAAGHEVSHAKGSVNIHLRFDKDTTNDSVDFLTIVVPPDEVATRGEYFNSICKQLFGETETKIVYAEHTAEMEAAIAKAKASLPDIRSRFIEGKLPKGALLQVKFPFEFQGDTEYLWAHVDAWEKPGVLNCHCGNNSNLASNYKVGQPIELKVDSIADWLLQVNGKVTEGDFTNKVLEGR